jgi:hypothetical protein
MAIKYNFFFIMKYNLFMPGVIFHGFCDSIKLLYKFCKVKFLFPLTETELILNKTI